MDNAFFPAGTESQFVNALRTQMKAEYVIIGVLPCPHPDHLGRMFENIHELWVHFSERDHKDWAGIKNLKPDQAKKKLEEAAHRMR